ncbi:MAG TPA: hypothetical protein DDW76_34735 [Cyanobacteria bacterium UBA11369]|nr:hypothetical protein [Cyanobacteria bacterium UBA11371]HBE34710.1 hypothetical protein [Cyanobacteria bacterium UBA11368]HBE53769.1 hypothetical protein [Cyanobacteria bacterium UBA11369]
MKRLRRLLLFFLAGLILVLSPAVDFHRPASPAEVAPATTQVEGVELPDLGQITFSTLPAIAESGSFSVPPEVAEALGYDPSRSWSAGQTAEEYLKLGDFQESFQLQKYNLETLAAMGGTSAETAKLSDFELLNRQTIGDLVTAVPELANRQISEVSPIADLLSQSVGNAFDPTQTLGFVAQKAELAQLSLGGIDLTIYDLNSIPGLKFAPLETFREWQNTLLKGVPGLKDIPWSQFLNPVTLSGGVGKVDVVLGSAEKNRAYTISGSYKEGFQVPCLQESCPHIEMAGLPLLKGRQWISGKAQKVKGGHGILGMVNGGKEPTGRHPFGNAFKVVLTAAKEAEAKAEFGLYFRFCAKTKFVDFGCTPYVIGPIPWIPAKEKDWIFLGLLEGIDKKAEAFKKPPAVGTPPINGNPLLAREESASTSVKTLKGEVTFNADDFNFASSNSPQLPNNGNPSNHLNKWFSDSWNATTQWVGDRWNDTTKWVGDQANNVSKWWDETKPKLGLFGDGVDVVIGFGKGIVDTAKGLWSLGTGVLGFGWDLLTNQEKAMETLSNLGNTITTIVQKPGLLWDAFKQPFVEDWNKGHPGQAIGRGVFEVASIFVGGGAIAKVLKGADKAADAGKLVNKLDDVSKVVDKLDDVGKAGDKLSDVSNLAARLKALGKLPSGDIPNLEIHLGKQAKHIPGSNNYKVLRSKGKHPSELIHAEPQRLINDKAGTGQKIMAKDGSWTSKEVVDFGENIGFWVDESNPSIKLPTTRGTIHYSKDGSHIVPAHPTGNP